MIEPIDSFSFKLKYEGGGELPAKLAGAYSYNRAIQLVEEFIKDQ